MAISKIEISVEEYKRLLLVERLYKTLEDSGVDTWHNYPEDKMFDLMNDEES